MLFFPPEAMMAFLEAYQHAHWSDLAYQSSVLSQVCMTGAPTLVIILLNKVGMQRRSMLGHAHRIVHYSNGKREIAPKAKLEKHLTGCLQES